MDLLDLFVKIGVEDKATKETSAIGETIKNTIGGAAKIAGAAVAAASAGIVALGTSAVKSYADFEQLSGGIETLFGPSGTGGIQGYAESVGKSIDEVKDDYDKLIRAQYTVEENSKQAFKTAGLSANEYMETVTSFSASLIASLGGDTQAAADMADKAVVMMADNSNKMGTSLESIQNAYRGFSKANFTMLDNLSLGYGGTAEEMKRLLKDASAISGVKYDISSYADIINAISVIQDKMGITDTTAEEASETISGSLGMLSSAWENVLTQMADVTGEGYLDEAINQLMESALAVFNNLMPAIETVLLNIPRLIEGLTPMIVELVPFIVEEVIPELVTSAVTLVESLSHALIEAAPALFAAAVQIATTLYEQFKGAIIERFPEAAGIFEEVENTIKDWAAQIWEIIGGFVEVLQEFWRQHGEQIIETLKVLWEDIKVIVDFALAAIKAVIDIFMAVLNGDWAACWEGIKNLVYNVLGAVYTFFKTKFDAIVGLLKLVVSTFSAVAKDAWGKLTVWLNNIADSIKNTITGVVEKAKNWGRDLIENFIGGIKEKWENLKNTISDVADSVKDFLGFSEPKKGPLSNFHTYAPDMMKLYAQGIRDNMYLVESELSKMPTLTQNGTGSVIHNYIEIGGRPLLDFVNEGLGATL